VTRGRPRAAEGSGESLHPPVPAVPGSAPAGRRGPGFSVTADLQAPTGPDLRLLPAAAATWAATWSTPLLSPDAVLPVAALTFAACAAGLAGSRRRKRSAAALVALLAVACAAAGAASSALRLAAIAEPTLAALAADSTRVDAELVVTGDPRRLEAAGGRPMVLVRARAERVEHSERSWSLAAPVLVIAAEEWMPLLPGERVRAEVRLRPPERGGDISAVMLASGPPSRMTGAGAVQSAAGALRAGLRDAASGLPEDERGLLPGLVVGDTSNMPASLEEDFRTAGLTHLTAVSGANVAIVVGAVLFAGRWAGVPLRVAPALAILALLGFLVLARPEPSVLRASSMGLIAIVALATGRRRAGLPSLLAGMLLLLLVDPWLARSYGFVLSVVATGGLLLLAPRWTDVLGRWMPRPVAMAIAVPAAAQAVCSPVLVLLAGEVSLIAVPANLLVAPAVAPATVLGVLAAVTAPVSDPAARGLAWLAAMPIAWIVAVGRRSADVPYAALPWPGGPGGAVLLAALLVIAVLGLRRLLDRPRSEDSSALRSRGGQRLVPGLPSMRVLGAAALAVVVLLRLTSPSRPGWPPPGWVLVACDVGQGDALVLAAADGDGVVIDAGPDPEAVDRCLRDLGIRRVPLLLLTHLHADHVAGVPGVLRGRQVAQLAVNPLDDPPEQGRRVRRWAAEAGLAPVTPGAGQVSAVGELSWEVVWPRRIITGEGSAPNNASLVLLVRAGDLRLLLTGDIEPPAQRAVREVLDGPVDVLKVPHHGSAHQDRGLFEAARPRLAIVSAGADNDYGHPAPPTLALLDSLGAVTVRTDSGGDVAVVGTAGDLRAVVRGR
jgi:competence protein ComEC